MVLQESMHKRKNEEAGDRSSPVKRRSDRMVLTERDVEVVRWVRSAGVTTREQIQRLLFSDGGRTRCQHRLGLLVAHRYLDVLPGRSLNEPAIYYLSRRCTKGLRLLRRLDHDDSVEPFHIARVRVDHTLGIARVRIALVQAAAASGFDVPVWEPEAAIAVRTEPFGLLPDGYLHLARQGQDRPRFPFFLEVERSSKSRAALEERFRRLGDYFYNGHYEAAFGERALRVLFVVAAEYGIRPATQIQKCTEICERLDVTFVRFAPLSQVLACPPEDLLFTPMWRQPGQETAVALMQKEAAQ